MNSRTMVERVEVVGYDDVVVVAVEAVVVAVVVAAVKSRDNDS